jgi:hypothetical protein
MSTEPQGAQFYDEHKQDRGWAKVVVRRKPSLGGLVVLDILTTEPELGSFLRALDKSRLQVQQTGEGGMTYRFAWASGYANGAMVRVQGVLENG